MKKYILGFLVGTLFSLGLFFILGNYYSFQKIGNIDITNVLGDKLNNIKDGILGISTDRSVNSLDNINNEELVKKMNNIKYLLDKGYYDPSMISGSKMYDYALQAYVAGLGDPFTSYLTSVDNKSLNDELKGTSDFQGIGAVVTKIPEGIMIEQLIKDGPAQKSGLKPLDVILEANGTGLANITLGKGVSLIKGPAGTEVELTIKRDGKIFKQKVKREKLKLTSVNSKIIDYKGKKIGYISISTIGKETYKQFETQINELFKTGILGIILDLRGNGGGYLDVGFKIGASWAKEGDIVVQTKYKNVLWNKTEKAVKEGKLNGFPTIILIDGYTASAGEIITASIKENNEKTTKLVGTKTFGKGTIQTIKEFSDKSSLKYTIGKWFTPKGNNVCKKGVLPGNGIEPDIELKFDSELYKKTIKDNQLEKAKEVLLKLIK